MLIVDLSFFDYSNIHRLRNGGLNFKLSKSKLANCRCGVVSGLVIWGKRACNVCADNLTFIVSSHLNNLSIV